MNKANYALLVRYAKNSEAIEEKLGLILNDEQLDDIGVFLGELELPIDFDVVEATRHNEDSVTFRRFVSLKRIGQNERDLLETDAYLLVETRAGDYHI